MAEGLLGGIIGSAGGILGGLLGAGKKPVIPAFKPIDFAAEQKQAIKQNLGSLSSASELAQKTTTADQSVLEEQLRRAIPGYDQLIARAGSNIGASLRGEISPEISSQVQRSTAGRALSGGFGGASGMGRSLTARDLGLTGMQIQNQGLQQAQSFIQQQRMFGMVQPFSTSSMFISPTQRMNLSLQENQFQFNRDMAAAQVAAQPDPMMAAIGGSLSNIGGMVFGGAIGGMDRKPVDHPNGGGGGGITLNYGGGGGGGVGYNPYGYYQPNMYSSPYGGYGVRYGGG